jgi:integrase
VEKWGTRAVVGIGRVDIVRLLDGIADRAPIVANRTRTRLLRFFGWCVERGILDQSPMAGVRRPVKEESRDRVLSDPELAEIWQATGGLGFPNGAYFRLLILTGQRRAEVATMRWADVSFDEELWTLPKGSTKANRQHFVPLAPTTLELLQTIPRFTGPYILTTSGGAKPISGYSKAKRRIDAAIIAARREAGCQAPMFEWRVHDLRRTMATTLAGLSVPPHVLGALLSHSPGRTMGITAVYNRFRYADECRRALEAWEQHVLNLGRQGARARKVG